MFLLAPLKSLLVKGPQKELAAIVEVCQRGRYPIRQPLYNATSCVSTRHAAKRASAVDLYHLHLQREARPTLTAIPFPPPSLSAPFSTSVSSFGRGTELYPRVFGADIKMFTNCRFGMMYWAVGAVIYAYAQQGMYGSLSSSMAVRTASRAQP